jgi:hypothetical protein
VVVSAEHLVARMISVFVGRRIRSLARSLTHSLTHSFTHARTHLLTIRRASLGHASRSCRDYRYIWVRVTRGRVRGRVRGRMRGMSS